MVGSRKNAAAHCRRNLGGAAALGSPKGRAKGRALPAQRSEISAQ